MPAFKYQVIIGLETHVQLLTQTKLFCRCACRFGDPPNTNTCPVCLGLPGALPVMNRAAFEQALKAAVGLNCEIPQYTKWDRKQYFYPDLPKGYQISQYDLPMSERGWVEIRSSDGAFEAKRVRIIRAHLEEDAGKSMHDETAGKNDSRIDLNRCGTPLLEIVTEPDMRSPAEARAYLDELKLLLTYLGVSDCNMQEGSLRVDANINLHIENSGETVATPIVEVKNMNSFRAVERALQYEIGRQFDVFVETGVTKGTPEGFKTTRGWDDTAEVTHPLREKEESSDYRYFPEPDLTPVIVSREQCQAVRAALGERPAELRERLIDQYGLSDYDANVIVSGGPDYAGYFLAVADGCGDSKLAANWVTQTIARELKERNLTAGELARQRLAADRLVELLALVQNRSMDTSRAKEVFAKMIESARPVAEVVAELGVEKVDESQLYDLARELLAQNPSIAADIQSGKLKAAGRLIGLAKQKNPNIDPGRFREICIELSQGRT